MDMEDKTIPVIVVDDTAVKRRGVCEFVNEAPSLHLAGQAGSGAEATLLVEVASQREGSSNPTLAGWLVLSDLRLGRTNGVELGRALLDLAPICAWSFTRRSQVGLWLPRFYAGSIHVMARRAAQAGTSPAYMGTRSSPIWSQTILSLLPRQSLPGMLLLLTPRFWTIFYVNCVGAGSPRARRSARRWSRRA